MLRPGTARTVEILHDIFRALVDLDIDRALLLLTQLLSFGHSATTFTPLSLTERAVQLRNSISVRIFRTWRSDECSGISFAEMSSSESAVCLSSSKFLT